MATHAPRCCGRVAEGVIRRSGRSRTPRTRTALSVRRKASGEHIGGDPAELVPQDVAVALDVEIEEDSAKRPKVGKGKGLPD